MNNRIGRRLAVFAVLFAATARARPGNYAWSTNGPEPGRIFQIVAYFLDVPADAFAAAWIEELYNEGIAAGCGGGNFCPGDTVLRQQTAALIVKAFGLS